MIKKRVLVVGSNATRIELQGGGRAEIGQYLNEIAVPAMALIGAGHMVDLATPDGTKPHIDVASDSPEHFGGDKAAHARAKGFYADHPSMNEVRSLASAIEEGLSGYAAVFVPGGHAPAVDLMRNADLGMILRHFHETGKPTALLCHAPVALVAAMPAASTFRAALVAGDKVTSANVAKDWIYAGYRMTVFSSAEEKAAEESLLHGKLCFHMPEALQLAGARVTVNPIDLAPNLIVDRELITGQNPASDHLIAAGLLEALDRSPATV